MQLARLAALALLLALVVAARAGATPIESTTGLASPAVAITFDEIALPASSPVGDHYEPLGISLDPGLLYNPPEATTTDGVPGIEGNRLANFYPVVPVFSIRFLEPVREAVVGLLAPDITTLTALLGGVEVESFQNSRASQAQGFYGFEGIVLDEIRIDAHSRFDEGRALVDNVQFTALPEPATGILIPLGLLAAGRRSGRCRPAPR